MKGAYNHVENLDALRGELQNRTLRALGVALNRKAMGRSGPTALRALAATFRRFANQYPGRYDLPETIDAERVYEHVLDIVLALLEAAAPDEANAS
jgi:hypothetical protein